MVESVAECDPRSRWEPTQLLWCPFCLWPSEKQSKPTSQARRQPIPLVDAGSCLCLARRSSPGGRASHRVVHVVGSGGARAPSGPPRHHDRQALPSRRTGTRFEPGTCDTPSLRAYARARRPRKTDPGRSAHTMHVPASPDRCPIPRDASTLIPSLLLRYSAPNLLPKPYRWRQTLLIAKADPL
jgi:hypothetical protein